LLGALPLGATSVFNFFQTVAKKMFICLFVFLVVFWVFLVHRSRIAIDDDDAPY